MKKSFLLIILCLPLAAFAQFPIPTIDLAIKPGFTSDLDDYIAIDYRLELNVHINQFLAIGGFYTRSVWGEIWGGDAIDDDFEMDHLLLGMRLQVSTGRIGKFRPYGFLTFTKFETVEKVSQSLNFSGKWTGVTFGGGLMLRLSNKMYFNLIEIEYLPVGGEFFFVENDKNLIAARLGVNYTFGKKR